MIDITTIRNDLAAVQANAARRNSTVDVQRVHDLDAELHVLKKQLDTVRTDRNANAASMKAIDPQSDEGQAVIAKGKVLKAELADLEAKHDILQAEYHELMVDLPNFTHDSVVDGPDESANVVLRQVGSVPQFDFEPQAHWDLGVQHDIIDNERGARISGARFTFLKGDAALLEFALIQHTLSVVTNRTILEGIIAGAGLNIPATPFIPVVPPVMVRPEVMQQMGRLEPRDERYHIESDDLYLVGSAEHTLGPLHMDETFNEADLPVRYIGFSTAFRREAGSYGKDTKGILRMHQFDKLEMETYTLPEWGEQEQDFIVSIQEHLMQSLELPYQVVQMCTGDMGDPDYRQIDIETWMPGQGAYRETHTSDWMTDYQSRRLNTKVQRANVKELVHMNDATAFAIGRAIIAILENNQQADGTITIPTVLQPFMMGRTVIGG